MVGALQDMNGAGMYAAASRVAMLSQVILTTAGIMIVRNVTAAFHGGRIDELRALISTVRLWIVSLSLPVYLVIMVFSSQLLSLFGAGFTGGETLLRILASGQLINAIAGPVALVLSMIGGQRILAVIMAVGAALNIALNAWAVPRWGAVGAATVSASLFALLNIALVAAVWRQLKASEAKLEVEL
jgi:O-antigen/teichoic acid export membrane protein